MKTIDELRNLVPELIETVEETEAGLVFPARAREIIHEIAEYGMGTEIWKTSVHSREQFWHDSLESTPETIYCYMLDRIANAPTSLHRDSSVVLIAPRLDELLCDDGSQNNTACQ